MLRHFCILCVAACSLWTAVVGLFLVACSGGSRGGGGSGNETEGVVKLFLGKLSVPKFDSISVDVSGDDMASIHLSQKSLTDNIKIEGIPQGEYRRFEVKIYADSGVLVQEGNASADIKADESIVIPITLEALFGFLRLEIPLGFINNTGVSSGKLLLDNKYTIDMKFENGKGVFNTGALPLQENLFLNIKLYNKVGELLFEGEDEITLYLISQTKTMQLHSNAGSAILELITSSEGPTQILAMLPESAYGKNIPKNYGDIFFTEIYASPASTEDDYFQYMELYNPTSNTLQLLSKHCRIVRTDNGTKHDIENLIIPPMSYAVIGRSKVPIKDYSCGTFALLKTAMNLGLFCGDSAIDTLTYSNKGDNKFPLVKGIAMQLPLENYETRTLGSSWCLGTSPGEDAICQ